MVQIEIYTTPYCPYCIAAKELLTRKGAAFKEIDVSRDGKLRTEMTKRPTAATRCRRFSSATTHVGGCDDLYALDGEGKLDPLLNETLSRRA